MWRLADNPLVRAVARIPVAVQAKLLTAFAIVVALLVAVGFLGINSLNQASNRVDSLGVLPERAAAYREIAAASDQLNTQLLNRNVAVECVLLAGSRECSSGTPSAAGISLAETDGAINLTLAELGPLTIASDLSFVPPPDEARIISQIRTQYVRISIFVSGLTAGDDAGHPPVPITVTSPGSSAAGANQTTVAETMVADADELGSIVDVATGDRRQQGQHQLRYALRVPHNTRGAVASSA